MNYYQMANILSEKKRTLGMSEAMIADRSGVSQSTTHRILSGKHPAASWMDVSDIARVLGIEITHTSIPAVDMLDAQAEILAKAMTGIMLATNQLEGQGIKSDETRRLKAQTKAKLLSGPKSRLWMEE